jgi:hypothetical protein
MGDLRPLARPGGVRRPRYGNDATAARQLRGDHRREPGPR